MAAAGPFKPPTLVASLLVFVFAGPFIAGFVGLAGLEMMRDESKPMTSDRSLSFLGVLTFGLGWFRLVLTQPHLWFLTIVPTALGAVLFWAISNRWFSIRPRSSRVRAAFAGALMGGLSSIVAWIAAISMPLKFDLEASVGSLIFFGGVVIPTGIVLGLLIGFSLRRQRPNSALVSDAKLPPI